MTVVNAGDVTASSTFAAASLTITNALGTATFSDTVTVTGASGNSFYVHGDTLVVDAVSATGGGNIVWEVENLTIGDTVGGGR